MSIKVALLDNLFWKNGSYSKPSQLPDPSNFVSIPVSPVMFSPYAGIVVIKGKDYNYAEYNGNLFFLSPIELLDKTNNKIKYSLIRDEWAYAVKNKIKLKGTVVKTLDPNLLEENLQLTQPVIPQPSKLNIVNLFEDEEDALYIHEPETLASIGIETTLSRSGVDSLINYNDNLGVLFPVFAKTWKTELIPYIEKLVEDIRAGKYVFGKVSQIESSIKRLWCMTPNEATKRIIEHPEDAVYISEIDLRNLKDVHPLSISNHLYPAEANTLITNIKEVIIRQERVRKAKKENGKIPIKVDNQVLQLGTIIKDYGSYYFVDEKLKNKTIYFPIQKEKWLDYAKHNNAVLEKILNKIDVTLSRYRLSTFGELYAHNRNWIKRESPRFEFNKDLNAPLPKLPNGTYDYDKIYEDYIDVYWQKTYTAGIQKSQWMVFYSSPRPKFWYEWYWAWNDPLGVGTYLALYEQLRGLFQISIKDKTIEKKYLINGWYKYKDPTFKDPKGLEQYGSIYTTTKEKLKTEMSLFDLEGTDYMLLIYKDAPHLIFKTAQLSFKGKRLNLNSLEDLPDLHLYEQINQTSFIQVFHKSIPLKDKINKNYDFQTSIKVMTHEDSISYDYAFIRHNGALDGICEIVEYPKRKVAAIGSVSGSEIENNYITQQRNYEDLQLKKKELAFKRSSEDLEWSKKWEEHNRKYVSIATDIALGLATAGLGFAKAKATSLAITAIAGGKLVKGGLESLGNMAINSENMAMLERKQLEGRALENYTLEMNHHRHDYDMKRNLRNMGNIQQAASVTYRDIIDRSNEELGANEIHLRVWTPTDLQLETITQLYENNGVDCFIGDVTIQIDENLTGVWQFSHIDAIETDDGMTLNYLLGLFINGVRIITNEIVFKEPLKTVQGLILPDNIKHRLTELENELQAQEQTTQIFKGLVSYTAIDLVEKSNQEIQLLNDEVQKQKDKVQEVENKNKELDNDKKVLTVQNTQLQTEKTQLQTQKEELQKSKDALEKQNNQLKTEKDQFQKTKEELEKQKTQLQTEKQDLNKAKAECEKLKTRLENEKNQLNTQKTQLQSKNQELQTKNQQLQSQKEKLQTQIQEQKQQAQTQRAELNTQKRQLEADKTRLEKANKDLEDKNKRQQQQLEEAKELIGKERELYAHKAEELKQLLAERNKLAEQNRDFQDCEQRVAKLLADKEELEKRPTWFEVDQKIKEENNKIFNQSIQLNHLLNRKNARLQSEVAGYKERLEECQKNQLLRPVTNEELLARIRKLEAEKLMMSRNLNSILEDLAAGRVIRLQTINRDVKTNVDEKTLKALNDKVEKQNQMLLELNKSKAEVAKLKNEIERLKRRPVGPSGELLAGEAECLHNYRVEYKKLYKLYRHSNLYAWNLTYLAVQVLDQWTLCLNPGYYNNSWWAENWRDWSYSLSLRMTHMLNRIVKSFNGNNFEWMEKVRCWDDWKDEPARHERGITKEYCYSAAIGETNRSTWKYLQEQLKYGNSRGLLWFLKNPYEISKFRPRQFGVNIADLKNWGFKATTALESTEFNEDFTKDEEMVEVPKPEELDACAEGLAPIPEVEHVVHQIPEEEVKDVRTPEEIEKQLEEKYKDQLEDLRRKWDICQNNLTTANQQYRDLETEKGEQEKLAKLYLDEKNTLRNWLREPVVTDATASADQKKFKAIGVGNRFSNMLLNGYHLRQNIENAIIDYKNRTRSHQQTIANIGWYLNYFMDGINRNLEPFIGESEKRFALTNKIQEAKLANIRQKRGATAPEGTKPEESR